MSVSSEPVPERLVTLGHIRGVYGVKGWVRVQSYTRPVDNLLDYEVWWIAPRTAPLSSAARAGNTASVLRAAQQTPETLYMAEVLDIRPQGTDLVAQLSGADGQPIEDRDVAASLIGREIQVDRADMPKPEDGEYYWADLTGLKVVSLSGSPLGTVSGLMDNGAQDVLIIDDQGVQRMIPFVRGPIVHSVDLQTGVIRVDWEADY